MGAVRTGGAALTLAERFRVVATIMDVEVMSAAKRRGDDVAEQGDEDPLLMVLEESIEPRGVRM